MGLYSAILIPHGQSHIGKEKSQIRFQIATQNQKTKESIIYLACLLKGKFITTVPGSNQSKFRPQNWKEYSKLQDNPCQLCDT